MSTSNSTGRKLKKTWEITWNFAMTPSTQATKLNSDRVAFEGVGDCWWVSITPGDEKLCFDIAINWEESTIGAMFGPDDDGSVKLNLECFVKASRPRSRRQLHADTRHIFSYGFPTKPTSDFSSAVPASAFEGLHYEKKLEFCLTARVSRREDLRQTSEELAIELFLRTQRISLEPAPHNVKFSFSVPGGKMLELWANAEVLSQVSPYLKTLLQAGAAEGVVTRGKRRRTEPVTLPPIHGDNTEFPEDSDTEPDSVYASRIESLPSPPDGFEYDEIRVVGTAFTTYRAVLTYLNTGYISFGRLSSSWTGDKTPTRREGIIADLNQAPNEPLASSPRSIYRLAHLLEIPNLQQLALKDYKDNLNIDSVATVLFSKTSFLYPELRNAALDLASSKWSSVKKSQDMLNVQEKVKNGELPFFAEISSELLSRL